ncbi:MAG: protein kinase [Actinobacteria bacterium]|nr:protein kinase [Actinomycetota bacterium]
MQVSGYTELAEIGRGGHAVVYRARQAAFDRVVALKVLARIDVDGQALRRFERECKAAGALSWHPHIVAVYDAGTTESGTPYLAMEYLEAGTFAGRLVSEGSLGWPEAVEVVVQTCGALETAHRAGTLHRDVKPENILIGPFGEARLADFGIAAVQQDPATLTSAGLVTATVAHAAPELFAGGRASPLSDVYSLGSTLFTLLTGRSAFVEPTDEMLAATILRLTTAPLPDLRSFGVPDAVARIVEWTMAKEPSERPESAEAFGRALQDLQRQSGQPVTDMRLRAVAPPRPAAGAGSAGEPSGETRVVEGLTPETPVPEAPVPETPVPEAPPPAPPTPPPLQESPEPEAPAHGGRRRIVLVGGAAAVVAAIIVGAALTSGGSDETSAPETVTSSGPSTTADTPIVASPNPSESTTSTPEGSVTFVPKGIEASSTAPPGIDSTGARVTYGAELAIDGLTDTAWRTEGDGVGETLVIGFDGFVHVTSVGLLPGYDKVDENDGTDRFLQNRRVVTVRYHFDGRDPVTAQFRDERTIQFTEIDAVTQGLTIEIMETTEVFERDFTAISEIQILGTEDGTG